MREVAEIPGTGNNVGNAVIAEDPDPNEDPLIYALSGADAALFSVDSAGQITVKSGTKLDFETRTTYMVTITATDSFSDSASIDVTITVTDADEAPDVTGDATKEYAENGTDPVATYTAVDPEGAAVKWSLSGDDEASLHDCWWVLAFVKSPNFEDAKDADPDNIYDVMVEATDGTGHVGRKAVKVEVTNVDEAGTVELSALQPAPGVMFTATLTDIDNKADILTDSAEWQWSKSRSKSGWSDIDKATSSAYTPEEDGGDSGYYLRATAKYRDKQSPSGADNDKTASMVSANKVLALRISNKAPEFAALVDGENTYDRTVEETAEEGQLVGDPVTAEDDNADDVLTYTLLDNDFDDNFVIDRATGQISVAKGATLNVTTDVEIDGESGVDEYMVTVIATDPKGIPTDGEAIADFSDTVEVTINVTAVDEPPIFTAASTAAAAVTFDETIGEITAPLGVVFEANDAEIGNLSANMVTLGHRGADSSKFTFVVGELKFKAAPNFEKPADADKSNVYEVTITATDGNANMATMDVKVTVTNAEELGEVTLSQTRPRVGLAITAGYSDPDGGLASATWQWYRTVSTTGDRPVLREEEGDFAFVPATGLDALDGDFWVMITDATSATYTPVFDDADSMKSDVGRYLVAVVSYTDAKQNVGMVPGDMARLVSANPVERDTRNRAPEFGDEDSDTPGTQNQTAMREVAENTEANVGNAVIAEDPDPNADPLTYVLSGADAALFSVTADLVDGDKGGQITVKSTTKLDFETRTTYMVTITATDSFGESASIMVTINVTDVDEEPTIRRVASSENQPPVFPSDTDARSVVEGTAAGADIGAPLTAEDPDVGDALTYTLGGADAASFDIVSATGQLQTKADLDYETKASYSVTVTASDSGGLSDSIDVTITVTDVDENVAPEFADSEDGARSVAENTVAGEDIGNPVAANDANGDALTYALSGTDATSFDIDPDTGQLMTLATLDYETKASYAVTVTATDGDNASDSIDVDITVTDVDEAGTGDTLVDSYDANDNSMIEKSEVLKAINDYLFGEGDEAISKPEVLRLINIYLFG